MTIGSGRPFALVASQRTGSTLLARSLDASPDIFCAGEIFHGGPNVHHAEFNFRQAVLGSRLLGLLVDSAFETTRVRGHLTRFFAEAGVGVAAVGFKIMTAHLRHRRSILPVLESLCATLLFLYRRDSFATALSYYKAKASGVYHSDRIDERMQTRVIKADAAKFGQQLKHCDSEKACIIALHSANGGVLLAYEDLVADWPNFVASVGQAVGISDLKVPKALEKLGAVAPSIRIENEDDLRRQFTGHVDP